ncbi:MAG: DUF3365 domain-containing protein [Myxococcales bacterium]|nr:DUF3365 domain-containing protein [Myxococcales bacterium]
MTSRIALPCLAVLAAACGRDRPKDPPAPPSSATPPAAAARGQQAVGALKQQLRTELSKALEGGTPHAIEVCGTAAKTIAERVGVDGLTLGRATRKPRNPANAVAGWQAEALAEFEATAAAGKKLDGAHYVRQLPDGQVRYAEPLVTQALCLKCHGADLEPDVRAALAAAYPDDQATGYADGALRGLAWAEYRATP